MKFSLEGLRVLGVSHESASVEALEKAAVLPQGIFRALDDLKAATLAPEIVLLSTCNRTEIYLWGGEAQGARNWLLARAPQAVPWEKEGEEAVRHLVRVTAGMESILFGEGQIQGQVKNALFAARKASVVGPCLNRLFEDALAAAKAIRTKAGVGKGSPSLARQAAAFLAERLSKKGAVSMLLLGAGQTARLFSQELGKKRKAHWKVAGPRLEAAKTLAQGLGGMALPMEERLLTQALLQADALVCAVASAKPLVSSKMLSDAAFFREKPLLVVDLGLPRNVEEAASDIEAVEVVSLFDLAGTEARVEEKMILAADKMVEEKTRDFGLWLKKRRALPLIRLLESHICLWQEKELARAKASACHDKAMEEMARRLSRKCLHLFFTVLEEASEEEQDRWEALFWQGYRHRKKP